MSGGSCATVPGMLTPARLSISVLVAFGCAHPATPAPAAPGPTGDPARPVAALDAKALYGAWDEPGGRELRLARDGYALAGPELCADPCACSRSSELGAWSLRDRGLVFGMAEPMPIELVDGGRTLVVTGLAPEPLRFTRRPSPDVTGRWYSDDDTVELRPGGALRWRHVCTEFRDTCDRDGTWAVEVGTADELVIQRDGAVERWEINAVSAERLRLVRPDGRAVDFTRVE